jgi:hypothetical protein
MAKIYRTGTGTCLVNLVMTRLELGRGTATS